MLQKTIKEYQSYKVVWVLEIIGSILSNQNDEIGEKNLNSYYTEIRKLVLSNQILHSRIGQLLSKVANMVGFDAYKIKGAWKNVPLTKERPSLS